MKKALVVASTFPRWRGDSTPGFVFDLTNLLSKKFDMKVLVPHYYKAKKHERMNNLDVYRFQYFYPANLQKVCYDGGILLNIKKSFLAKIQIPFFLLSEFFSIKKIIKKEKIGILHAHWLIPQGFLCVFFKKKYRIPLVVSVHGSDVFPLRNWVFRFVQGMVLKNCDICTVNSNATKNELIRRFPEFKNKIRIIPMGVDVNFFNRKNVKNKFKEYKHNKIILFVGRLSEQKGIQYLIKSIPSINKKIKNIKLLIVGEGAYKRGLMKIIKKLNLINEVEFKGALPRNELTDYYNLADAVVMPSLAGKAGTEGQGLVLLEAMTCGKAVIGTDIGGIKDIIKDGKNGLLVKQKDSTELANKIVNLINDSKLRKRIERNGKKFAIKNYSWQNIVKQFEITYQMLTKGDSQ